MRETYSESITQISDLGGATTTVTTSSVVCDRCGRQFPNDDLILENGFYVCEECLDEDSEDSEN